MDICWHIKHCVYLSIVSSVNLCSYAKSSPCHATCICCLCPCYSVRKFESQHGNVEVNVKKSTIVNILIIFFNLGFMKSIMTIIKDKTLFVENNNTFILYPSL